MEKSLARFERDAHIKAFFADSPKDSDPPALYVESKWRPPIGTVPQVLLDRLPRFYRGLKKLFVRSQGEPNLLPFQLRLLAWLKKHPDWIVANTDKNLGPCIIERDQYIKDALVHLNNKNIYQILSPQEAATAAHKIESEIREWTVEGRKKKVLSDMDINYIRSNTGKNSVDPHGYFYLLYKVHKKELTTRPVCSDVASITNPIGKWVDLMLKPIMEEMPTYFKDSFAFLELVENIVIPPGCSTFTSDAVNMYGNINTDAALSVICAYLRQNERRYGHYHAPTLIRALEIVMTNNIIRFGDIYVRQISGTAMGKPPAPAWATIFEGLHEIEFLPCFESNLLFYKRFIDDVFGIWKPSPIQTEDDANWQGLIAEVNNNHGLEWVFTKRLQQQPFLDMVVKIDTVDGRIKTSLYEKPMALHLYIPPHSSHPPGVLTGHIYGNLLRIFRLNSCEDDIVRDTLNFYERFLLRGHTNEVLKPLFLKGIANARKFQATSKAARTQMKEKKAEEAARRLYLHIEYHPQNPATHRIQQLFQNIVLNPPGETPLNEVEVYQNVGIPIDAMIIANHRAPNLGELFSYRDISKRNGPPVSSFL